MKLVSSVRCSVMIPFQPLDAAQVAAFLGDFLPTPPPSPVLRPLAAPKSYLPSPPVEEEGAAQPIDTTKEEGEPEPGAKKAKHKVEPGGFADYARNHPYFAGKREMTRELNLTTRNVSKTSNLCLYRAFSVALEEKEVEPIM